MVLVPRLTLVDLHSIFDVRTLSRPTNINMVAAEIPSAHKLGNYSDPDPIVCFMLSHFWTDDDTMDIARSLRHEDETNAQYTQVSELRDFSSMYRRFQSILLDADDG